MTSTLSFPFATQQLRVVMRDGEPWFVAADVCAALALGDTSKAVSRLDDDERGTNTVRTPSGDQQMLVINESGLYSLTLTSRKPEAKRFKKWVTSEVLPSIRKTGRYQAPAATTPPQAAEQLNAHDMGRITNIVWQIGNRFGQHTAWTQAIWFALRRATGVPAPQRFTVQHLPTLAAELRRCWVMGEALSDAQREAQAVVLKRIIRRGEQAEPLLIELRAQLLDAAQTEREHFTGVLADWHESELAKLTASEPLLAWNSAWDVGREPVSAG